MAIYVAQAWLLTILLAVAAAIYKGLPLIEAFASIPTWPAFYFSIAVFLAMSFLAAVQLATDYKPFGQEPMTLAGAIMLVYAWLTIFHCIRKA